MCSDDAELATLAAVRLVESMRSAADRQGIPALSVLASLGEAAIRRRDPRPEDPQRFVERHLEDHVFAALLNPADPWGSEWVCAVATDLALAALHRQLARFGDRYTADPANAEGFGSESLRKLAKHMVRHPGTVDRPLGYLYTIVNRLVIREATNAYRERNRLATYADMVEDLSLDADMFAGVLTTALFEAIERRMPTRAFSKTDRDTWRLLKESGLDGRAIDYSRSAIQPCSQHTGAQRLLTLMGKLQRVLDDWR
jgi:hypothetical protein